ncbi:ATP synthase F1 subunit delta [Sulfidibacter corallicola]|uniref:ATP synthase subunit delta n=1 Tax=Sulfidibacter corallicola TaxID=2818388 RepID=A0A8A4TWG7_SULCO|nr:ATP synthase F1 subunit delta [Sulfidibacter corallicola]QTD54289.1 ATP synthase F1 subunit delta [Sulfidibacter corallicola]
MSAARVAARYAKAFVDALSDQNRLGDAESFLEFCEVVDGNGQLRRLFANYAVSPRIKTGVVDALAKKLSLSGLSLTFLQLLVKKRRLDILSELRVAVNENVNRKLNIQPVKLVTAASPSAEEVQAFSQGMGARLGCEVKVESRVDASLLGGAIAQVGSVVYDGSVRGRLDRLRQELIKEK